jgi:hypothetical protein
VAIRRVVVSRRGTQGGVRRKAGSTAGAAVVRPVEAGDKVAVIIRKATVPKEAEGGLKAVDARKPGRLEKAVPIVARTALTQPVQAGCPGQPFT